MSNIFNDKLSSLKLQLEENKNNEYIKENLNLHKILSEIEIKIIKNRQEIVKTRTSILQIHIAPP